jgi:hypothetical protein
MKICLVTNYLNKGYTEEIEILNQLKITLKLSSSDVVDFSNANKVYDINNDYTHVLILLDYHITSYKYILNFISELTLPKTFIIDSIPEVEEMLDKQFTGHYSATKDFYFPTIQKENWNKLYLLADSFIFYNDIDYLEFTRTYDLENIKKEIIPPSLGKKEDIVFNFQNVIKNKNIGFIGSPSYSKGIFHYGYLHNQNPTYNFSMYGSHGKNPLKNESIANHITTNCNNSKFCGRLKDKNKFYLNNFVYYDFALYSPFSYFMYKSLINGVIPIISKNTSSYQYLPNYPFASEYMDISSFNQQLLNIENTPVSELIEIMSMYVEHLSNTLNDDIIKNIYYKFLKSTI